MKWCDVRPGDLIVAKNLGDAFLVLAVNIDEDVMLYMSTWGDIEPCINTAGLAGSVSDEMTFYFCSTRA